MTPSIEVFAGAKGGVGTTATAVSTAILLARAGRQVLLTAYDADAMAAVLGVAAGGGFTEVMPNLTFYGEDYSVAAWGGEDYQVVIYDYGVVDEAAPNGLTLVVTNDYLALRRGSRFADKADRLVLVKLADRALSEEDVRAVFNLPDDVPMAVVDSSAALARSVDAGLLTSFRRFSAPLLAHHASAAIVNAGTETEAAGV